MMIASPRGIRRVPFARFVMRSMIGARMYAISPANTNGRSTCRPITAMKMMKHDERPAAEETQDRAARVAEPGIAATADRAAIRDRDHGLRDLVDRPGIGWAARWIRRRHRRRYTRNRVLALARVRLRSLSASGASRTSHRRDRGASAECPPCAARLRSCRDRGWVWAATNRARHRAGHRGRAMRASSRRSRAWVGGGSTPVSIRSVDQRRHWPHRQLKLPGRLPQFAHCQRPRQRPCERTAFTRERFERLLDRAIVAARQRSACRGDASCERLGKPRREIAGKIGARRRIGRSCGSAQLRSDQRDLEPRAGLRLRSRRASRARARSQNRSVWPRGRARRYRSPR